MISEPSESPPDDRTTQSVTRERHPSTLPSAFPPGEREVIPHDSRIGIPLTRPTSRLPWIIGMGATLLALGAGAWYWWVSSTPPVTYKTLPVDRGPITSLVMATGTVNPVMSVQVGSQVSGKIAALFVDFNSEVTKGQALARIDRQPFQARVAQARASVKSASAGLAKAKNLAAQRKRDRDRMAALREHEFISQAELDLAETNYQDALAQVEAAQAQLDQAHATLAAAELDLDYTTISSPVDGIVISRNVDVGQTVAASFQTPTLFVIARDLTRMQVNANVSEADIGGVVEGKSARFRVDAYPREWFEGTVAQVRHAPVVVQNVVTYDVVITVDNRHLKLKPGMTATVTIVTDEKERALRVPNGALRFRMPGAPIDRKTTSVWVQDADRHVRRVPVTTGIADSLYTEIVDGAVREGDQVVVGIETLDEGRNRTLPPGFELGPKVR